MLLKRLFLSASKDFFRPSWNRYRAPKIKDTPGLSYGGGKVDLYRRPHSGKLPVFIYLHGGVSAAMGRQHRKGICRALAEHGCAVLCPDIGRDAFPAQLKKIGELTVWATQNAQTFGLDTERFIYGGDGGGAFLAAAMCRALTDQDYAERAGYNTKLPVPAGAVFFSGIYDLPYALEKKAGSGFPIRLAAAILKINIKEEDIRKSSLYNLMRPAAGLGPTYPPVFFAHSPSDTYCPDQGDLLRKALESAGVPYWEFFAAESRLPHIFNLNPSTEDARACNSAAGDFLEKIKNGNPGYVRFDI